MLGPNKALLPTATVPQPTAQRAPGPRTIQDHIPPRQKTTSGSCHELWSYQGGERRQAAASHLPFQHIAVPPEEHSACKGDAKTEGECVDKEGSADGVQKQLK